MPMRMSDSIGCAKQSGSVQCVAKLSLFRHERMGPYVASVAWFRAYWLLWTAILGLVAILFWVRGRDSGWRNRLRSATQALTGTNRVTLIGLATALILVGGFIYYNTNVLNTYTTTKVREKEQVAYEQKYKRYQTIRNHVSPT